ncbi:MAG: ribonuclease E, partial [Gammaproteobacteria bacterium]|nr:ribonuclease E [Gammaproteobacteria bacterium]
RVLSLGSRLGGQGYGRYQIDFKSSINKVNLRRVENQIRSLQSPLWPQDILGQINWQQAAQGEKIFERYCISCHKNIQRDEPSRRVISHISKLSKINTDPVLADNTINYQGYSGLLRNQYVDSSLGKLVIEKKMPVASLVKFSTGNVVTHTDPDRLPGFRSVEWLWGILKALKDNPIKKSARQGNFQPAAPETPLAPLMGYKARSLNGIWATAPYLHNGSVPNLYELLLPKKRPGDPDFDENGEEIEYRSDRFLVGSRQFDPIKVGFRSTGYEDQGFIFNTSLRANSNAGHEYAAGRTAQLDGRILEPLTAEQRSQLLEYLKSL